MGIRQPSSETVAAEAALRALVASYSRAIDRRDFALLASLYWEDATEDHGDMFKGPAADYVAFVATALGRYEATAHYVTQALFVIDGDRAEGEIYKLNVHRTHPPDAHEMRTGSRSLDRYERRAGEWRFAGRSVTLDWAERRPVDVAAAADFAAMSPPGRAGADDPSYLKLRLLPRHDGDGR